MPVATPAKGSSSGAALAGDYKSGDVIAGKYRLESVLGEGGMGSVWRARNMTLHVEVAVKLIRRGLASDEAAQRLLNEARAAAQLGHPSIVRVHDFGETEHGDPFIVMELLRGESLGDLIDRKRLEPTEAVQLLLPILSALALVHQKGIIHRDIKPDNILLVDDAGEPVPKLVDFGIAHLPHATVEVDMSGTLGETTATDLASRLTQSGHLLGSPHYMAPEQARGDIEIDHRADLWAISIVLYEALCGVAPFDHPDHKMVLVYVLTQEAQPIAEHGVRDPELWRILQRGLAKDRQKRWQSARELGEALAGWLVDRGVDTDASGRSIAKTWLANVALKSSEPPRRAVWPFFAAAAGVAVVTAAVVLLRSGDDRRAPSAPSTTTSATATATATAQLLPDLVPWEGRCRRGSKLVPGGTFRMGSDDPKFPYWKPAHQVTVGAFCLDDKEVTVADYRACVERGTCPPADVRPSFPKREDESVEAHQRQLSAFAELCNADKTGRDDHPINCVDWFRAEIFCKARDARLPTEAEWELAARGTDGRRFPWGNDHGDETYMNAAGIEWRRWLAQHDLPAPASLMYDADDHWVGTAPVGRFMRAMTQTAQLDMVGNVWEWMADWYAPYGPESQVDPRGPAEGDRKVIRGGGFNGEVATWLNPAARYFQLATASVHAVGFRCAAPPRAEP